MKTELTISEISSKPPKVSVCIVTYNQEKYIRQCIESIVNQKTDFTYEVIIGDDASTDKTRNIIDELKNKYTIIKTVYHKKNIGASANFLYIHNMANGEYIAHVDGDDYYFHEKLQRQSDLLDSEPQCNIVWHRMQVVDQKDNTIRISPSPLFSYDKKYYASDILQLISIGHNSSKMYRRINRKFPIPNFDTVDYYANIYHVKNGYARVINEALGVYRSGIGISSINSKTKIALNKCFLHFFKELPQHRLQINIACLGYMMIELKNRRSTFFIFGKTFLKTFHYKSLFLISKHITDSLRNR